MNDRDHALVIGIDRYPYLTSLQGAVNDAEEFGIWLRDVGQVPEPNVHLLTSKLLAEADRPILDQIDDALVMILSAAERAPVRRLYIYFAGHGGSRAFRHLALIMANADVRTLNRSLDTAQYHESLAGMATFAEQVFFYDCCRNYDTRVMGRPPIFTNAPPGGEVASVSQFILYGSVFTEEAKELYSTNRGLFTVALIEGLGGAAAHRENGTWVVRWTTLVPYVNARVGQLAQQAGLSQRVSSEQTGAVNDIVLASDIPPQLQEVTISTQLAEGEFVVRDGIGRTIEQVPNPGEPVVLQLPAGTYTFRHEPSMATVTSEVRPREDLSLELPGG